MTNFVYIGTSLDGLIADADGGLDWLEFVPAPEGDDLGFSEFMARVDAVVMGRKTFETLIGFGLGWHYAKPGLILSTTIESAPSEFADQVSFLRGSPAEIVAQAEARGYQNLYIDGGETVQRFLRDDLIDELIITQIPILLGGGTSLFGPLDRPLGFELIESKTLASQLVKRWYRRKRSCPGLNLRTKHGFPLLMQDQNWRFGQGSWRLRHSTYSSGTVIEFENTEEPIELCWHILNTLPFRDLATSLRLSEGSDDPARVSVFQYWSPDA